MLVKTSELIGPTLDWAVAKCEGVNAEAFHLYYEPTEPTDYDSHGYPEFHYSSIWAQGGPIIEREWINPTPWPNESREDMRWHCQQYDSGGDCAQYGPTLLIAAMRCYVASKLGDTVEIPEELLKVTT